MAQPIIRTPDLEGKDAKRFLALHSEQTLSKKDKQILKSSVQTYQNHK